MSLPSPFARTRSPSAGREVGRRARSSVAARAVGAVRTVGTAVACGSFAVRVMAPVPARAQDSSATGTTGRAAVADSAAGPPGGGRTVARTSARTGARTIARAQVIHRTAPVRDAGRDAVRICAGGDITLGTNLDTAWVHRVTGKVSEPGAALRAPDSLVAPLRPLLADADVVLFNLEGALGEGVAPDAKCLDARPFCFALRSPRAAARALRGMADSGSAVIANVANNHTRDAGAAGFDTTLALLEGAGLLVAGVDTEPALVVTPGGDTVAVLGFSAWSAPSVADTAAVRRIVARAAARYRRVIVTAHLGAEGRTAQHTPDSLERFAGEPRGNPIAFARTAADAGARLVIGHGPHVLRAVEWYRGALIFYSLGNLVNYGPFKIVEPMNRGAIACATLGSAGWATDAVLRPTWQPAPGTVRPDRSRRALALVDVLSRSDFPLTGAAVDGASGALRRRPVRRSGGRARALNRRQTAR